MTSQLMTEDEVQLDSRAALPAVCGSNSEGTIAAETLFVDLCGLLGDAPLPMLPASAEVVDGRSIDDMARFRQRLCSRLVLLLPIRPTKTDWTVINACAEIAARSSPCFVCVVSSFRAHFGDDALEAFEDSVRDRFRETCARTIVLRTGNLVEPGRHWPASWARVAPWSPLIPESIASVFVSRNELFAAIEYLRRSKINRRDRRLTLLGRRRTLRDLLAEIVRPGPETTVVSVLALLLSWLQVGRLAGLVLAAAARIYWPLKFWQMITLNPSSPAELLSLYHPSNQPYVALAGYNTGVNHFGWKYPGKTVVTTTGSGRLVRVGERTVTVDAGVLLKQVIHELRARDKELYVVPNYSYVSLGTTFMVPVHGSGSEVSTLGESIEQVLAYDPSVDCIVRMHHGDEQFSRCMYNPSSGILVLRLTLRIRDKSRYFVKRTRLDAPTAGQIWQVFSDPEASNIELRKSRAADKHVEVTNYYTAPTDDRESLEVPRDSIGRLWDRLEENSVTSWLFHTYVRKCGFHVELFLNEREFDVFWRAHAALPLSKLQLRLVRRDGLPHSPFGDCDRICVDIFMQRRNSAAFLSFMKEHLPHARYNPGKHSM